MMTVSYFKLKLFHMLGEATRFSVSGSLLLNISPSLQHSRVVLVNGEGTPSTVA